MPDHDTTTTEPTGDAAETRFRAASLPELTGEQVDWLRKIAESMNCDGTSRAGAITLALIRERDSLRDALSFLVWRLSEGNGALSVLLGDDGMERLRAHLEGAIRDARKALGEEQGNG